MTTLNQTSTRHARAITRTAETEQDGWRSRVTTKEEKVGYITQVWVSLMTEVFTDASTFEVNFPADASQESKARLLGANFLINQVCFRVRWHGV